MTTHDMPAPQTRRSLRWLWIVLGGVILAAVLFRGAPSLFGGGQADPGPPVAGTTVTWEWEGDRDHNVVGDDFESPVQDEGEFAYTFTDPGTYDYRCTLHGGMNGGVVVTAVSA